MRATTRTWIGWITAAASLIPAGAMAQSAHGIVSSLDAHFAQTVDQACEYTASVRGTLRSVHVPNATSDQSLQFAPDLRVRAELRCPGGGPHHVVSSVVHGAQYSAAQLADTLQDRARVVISRGPQVCEFTPRLSFDGALLEGNGISQTCETARGGGPQDIETQVGPLVAPDIGADAPSRSGLPPLDSNPPHAIGGGPRDTIEQTDTRQGQHGISNHLSEPPLTGHGGTGRDISDPRSLHQSGGVRQIEVSPLIP